MFKMITRSFGKVALNVKKYSPEIKLALGLAAEVAAIAVTIKATFDTADILEEPCAEKDASKRRTAIVKKYIPTAGLTMLSMGLTISSFREMKARYVGMVALYNGLSAFFQSYRQRVQNRWGVDAEKEIYYGEVNNPVKSVDEKGKETETDHFVADLDGASPYTVIFSEYLPNGQKNYEWDETPTFNKSYVSSRESIANDLLNRRGHVFLNEVLDGLGFPMTKAGAVVGWKKGNGDNVVDFNIQMNERESVKNYLKDHGYPEGSFVLDFNVDGVIFDKI